MKIFTPSFIMLFACMFNPVVHAQVPVKASHVIIVMEENYAYNEIIGSPYAPTINWLSGTSYTANFTQDYAITHPSQPNYLCLFSGSYQTDCCNDYSGESGTAGTPFNDCNMGSSLIQNGYTFIGYSESQPSIGWNSADSPPYYTKHCPWINWMGYNTNPDTIPITSDLPYTSFPDSNHYASLPTVSWVIPNINDDMHNPGTPSIAISNGDAWFKTHIMPLVRWASNPVNKTIVITTWDEDDGGGSNNIPLLISGGIVNGGNYNTTLNHYDVLKTIEDMYSLSLCGSSASGVDLPVAIWNTSAGISSIPESTTQVSTWLVPAKDELDINITTLAEGNATIRIYNFTGQLLKEIPARLKSGENTITLNTSYASNGLYFLKITGDNINTCNKIAVAK